MNRWYKLSLVCGLTPLITGITIFTAWLPTKANWLELAGIYNIAVGFILFICGIIFLGIYIKQIKKEEKPSRKRIAISLTILLINFPAALTAIYTAGYIMNISTVTIENNSPFSITEITFTERDISHKFPPIKPNRKISRYFHFINDGAVHYSCIINNSAKEGILFEYLSGGMSAEVTVNKDGTIKISEKSHSTYPF
ncbi:MAG: hypothetical protein D6B27_00140 [Gammaproteobacteria bacterium]|nr:MAG: hypothetical protein D6B27_00140 [Gammaproteobacteria bacterium]